jgi:uncharacterized protein DUF4157
VLARFAAAVVIGASSIHAAEVEKREPPLSEDPLAGDELDPQLDAWGDFLTPAAVALFDDIAGELRTSAAPLPASVRARLRPYFDGRSVGGVPLDAKALERARYVVDHPRTRDLFASLSGIEAVTFGDVIAFPRGQYRPECIEGIALLAHEAVHVAQYDSLGREAFLKRYFLTNTLARWIAGEAMETVLDPTRNRLEADAYCVQARVCRELAASAEVPGCGDRVSCPKCPDTL